MRAEDFCRTPRLEQRKTSLRLQSMSFRLLYGLNFQLPQELNHRSDSCSATTNLQDDPEIQAKMEMVFAKCSAGSVGYLVLGSKQL